MCFYDIISFVITGCSAAWLAYLLWEQGVVGSNPTIPTIDIMCLAISG